MIARSYLIRGRHCTRQSAHYRSARSSPEKSLAVPIYPNAATARANDCGRRGGFYNPLRLANLSSSQDSTQERRDRMPTVVHVTHEAIQKIGGIGAVLQGLLTSPLYLEQIHRNILVGPFWPTDTTGEQRLGPHGEVLYSS